MEQILNVKRPEWTPSWYRRMHPRRGRKDVATFSSHGALEPLSSLHPMFQRIKGNDTSIFDLRWFNAISVPKRQLLRSWRSSSPPSIVQTLFSFFPLTFPSPYDRGKYSSFHTWKCWRFAVETIIVALCHWPPRLIRGCENKSANTAGTKRPTARSNELAPDHFRNRTRDLDTVQLRLNGNWKARKTLIHPATRPGFPESSTFVGKPCYNVVHEKMGVLCVLEGRRSTPGWLTDLCLLGKPLMDGPCKSVLASLGSFTCVYVRIWHAW